MVITLPSVPPTITSEVLKTAAIAQLRHAHAMTDEQGIEYALTSDDSFDYCKSALQLAADLLVMQYDQDLKAFAELLDPSNRDTFVFSNYASDGISGAINDLLDKLVPDWEDTWEESIHQAHPTTEDPNL